MKTSIQFGLLLLLVLGCTQAWTPKPMRQAHAELKSWQDYVDQDLVGSGHIRKAMIITLDGTFAASSPTDFQLLDGEAAALVALYQHPTDAYVSGIRVSGEKYIGIRADELSIFGRLGAKSVLTVKTNKLIIIALADSDQQPGNAVNVLEPFADLMRSKNF